MSNLPEDYDSKHVWELDSLDKSKQIGTKVAERLAKEKNLKVVADLKQYRNTSMKEIVTHLKVKGISAAKLAAAIRDACSLLPLPGA